MTIDHTPYPEVSAALKTRLELVHPKKVFRGAPLDRLGDEYIAIGGIEEGLNEWAVMRAGRKPTNGSFKLIVNIGTYTGGSDPTEAETKALTLFRSVEDTVVNDPTLGLDIPTLRCIVSDYELDSFQSAERSGWSTDMVVKILVEFRRV